MTQTISVEEIPVPLSLFLFRHYLNNMQSERKSLKKPPSATPTTYFISTDPVPINDNTISSAAPSVQPPLARPSSGTKNNSKKLSVTKYRNLAATTLINDDDDENVVSDDKIDTTWMNTLETSSEPPSQKKKGKSKNKTKKKQKQAINSKNAKVDQSASIKVPSLSTQDTKLQDIIAPFLLVNVNDNDDDESWTTVTKR